MLLLCTVSKLTSLVIATLLKNDILMVKLFRKCFILLLSYVGLRGTLILLSHHTTVIQHSLKSLWVGWVNLTIWVVYRTQPIKVWWILARNLRLSYSLLAANHTPHSVCERSTWIWTLRSRWQVVVGLSLHCATRVTHICFVFQNDLIVIYLSSLLLGLHLLFPFRIHFFSNVLFVFIPKNIFIF